MNVLYVQLLLFGVCIGVVSGMLGIGGGILLVPGLILLFGFSQQEAQGTSLAALSTPIFVFAAIVYYQSGHVRIPVAGAVAIGIMLGAIVGALAIPYVPLVALRLAFGGLLLYMGLMLLFGPSLHRSAAALPAGVAALVVAIAAWLTGRRPEAGIGLPPPNGETEYHI